jgi:DNA gyrase inhibitor GyrI
MVYLENTGLYCVCHVASRINKIMETWETLHNNKFTRDIHEMSSMWMKNISPCSSFKFIEVSEEHAAKIFKFQD